MFIYFRNELQVALYEQELKGQISDGLWENSTPYNHYQRMCNAKARVADSRINDKLGCVDFYPLRRYGFSSPLLFDCVGDRMLAIARAVPGWANITPKELKRELRDMSKIVNRGYDAAMGR